jgi:hypothetical protein
MALDALAEIAIRVAGQIVIEVLLVGIFYWPGWLILRVVTIGRYPPQQSQPHSREFVAMVAFAAFLIGIIVHFSGGA